MGIEGGKASLTGVFVYTNATPAFTKEKMSNATVIFFQKMTISALKKKYGNEQGRKILLSQISPNLPAYQLPLKINLNAF